jgi:hypothetical protein
MTYIYVFADGSLIDAHMKTTTPTTGQQQNMQQQLKNKTAYIGSLMYDLMHLTNVNK